jgi:hypothetical protein
LVITGSWDQGNGWNNRWATAKIFQWYQILSPRIDLSVDSVAFDKSNHILYVGIHQTFQIWFFAPLAYKAEVDLTTKLGLVQNGRKYYIQSQNDLYQVNEWTKFWWFGIWRLVWIWQALSLIACIIMAYILTAISWLEESWKVGDMKSLPANRKSE